MNNKTPLFIFVFIVFAQSRCFLNTPSRIEYGPLNVYSNPTGPSQKSQIYLNGVSFELLVDGNLQVTEKESNLVLWNTGLKEQNCTNGCRCGLQGDGNFVCHGGNGGYWSTGTWSCCNNTKAGSRAQILSDPPYFAILGVSCQEVWSASNTTKRTISTPLYRSTGYITPKPLPSNQFYQTFGICTHLTHGWNPQLTANLTHFVGASAIRDGMPAGNYLKSYEPIYEAGIKVTAVLGGSNTFNASNVVEQLKNASEIYPGMVISVEGFNEINNWPFVYNDVDPTVSYAGMAQAMKDLYQAIKSSTLNIPVFHLTGALFGHDAVELGLDKLTGYSDIATIHPYSYGGDQAVVGWTYFSLDGTIADWKEDTPRAITEFGWPTIPNNTKQGVTELAQAKMTVNALFNAIRLGFSKAFVYELIDEKWGNPDSIEEHFGLFYNDKSPKPVATVLRQISSLLKDNGTQANPRTLNYTINGIPDTVSHLLFQMEQPSSFWIAIWNDIAVYDAKIQKDIVNNKQFTVKVQLGSNSFQAANFTVYNPYSDVIKGSPKADETTNGAQEVDFKMSDYLLLVKIEPTTYSAPPDNNINPDSSALRLSSLAVTILGCITLVLVLF